MASGLTSAAARENLPLRPSTAPLASHCESGSGDWTGRAQVQIYPRVFGCLLALYFMTIGLLLFFSTHPLGFTALGGRHVWSGFVSLFSLQYPCSMGVGMLGLLGIFPRVCLRRSRTNRNSVAHSAEGISAH